jgi:hypothetical protein
MLQAGRLKEMLEEWYICVHIEQRELGLKAGRSSM